MRLKLAAALVAAAIATPAFAQDAGGDFNGFHLEALAALDHTERNNDEQTTAAWGAGAGFDFATSGGIVVGAEGEYMESELNNCVGVVCTRAGRDYAIGGRIGFLVDPVVLLYVKGAYANSRVSTVNAGTGTVLTRANLDGIRGAVGVEYNNGGMFTVRMEYRYTDYETNFRRHQALLGLGIRL
jgi:outer membrane immunogenic protein